jgi:RND family efflux transporter MFP subunit
MTRTTYLGLALLAACGPSNDYVAPPPPAVTVAPPVRRDVVDYAEFTGTTAPHKVVEIRARVQGFVAGIEYEPGSVVEEGAVLFRIAPAEFESAVRSAEAEVRSAQADEAAAVTAITSAKAAHALADTAVKKLERAYESRAVSEILVLEVQAKREVAQAEIEHAYARKDVANAHVGVAEARLVLSRLDLSYTTVKAPMRGRVAMWNVEVGALVGAGEPTLLTTMINDEKVFCYFDVAERWMLEVRQAIRERQGETTTFSDLAIDLALATEEGYTHHGHGDYIEPTVDPDTGTLRLRAIFDNQDRAIPAGAFARIRFAIADRPGALLVLERAVGTDQVGDFVLVVNADDVVERRGIELGARHGDLVVALDGIGEDDRIIVSGLQRARPGAKVRPETDNK